VPNIITATWLGTQSAASLANWFGHVHGLEREPAFNAIAIPLNFAAAPIVSSVGLLWAGLGEITGGFTSHVSAFGGMLVFDHRLCPGTTFNLGATGHCFRASAARALHEGGHQVQFSIMGDVGTISLFVVDGLVGTIGTIPAVGGAYLFLMGPGGLTLEPWANDYERTFRLEDD